MGAGVWGREGARRAHSAQASVCPVRQIRAACAPPESRKARPGLLCHIGGGAQQESPSKPRSTWPPPPPSPRGRYFELAGSRSVPSLWLTSLMLQPICAGGVQVEWQIEVGRLGCVGAAGALPAVENRRPRMGPAQPRSSRQRVHGAGAWQVGSWAPQGQQEASRMQRQHAAPQNPLTHRIP